MIGNDRILSASSILDYVFRELAISYLGKEELAHTPSIANSKNIDLDSDDDKFLKIELGDDIIGTIKRSNLSKDKNEQKVDRFALEEQVDSIIISVDQKTRTLNLSIKEIEINDEKEALSKYGSSDSGASLGDILGSILKKKE